MIHRKEKGSSYLPVPFLAFVSCVRRFRILYKYIDIPRNAREMEAIAELFRACGDTAPSR